MALFKVSLICILFLQIFTRSCYTDQVRGVIVDPNAPQHPGSPQGTTPETIYFGATDGKRGGENRESGTGFREQNGDDDGKWVRRSTGLPVYQRTTPNFGGDADGDEVSTVESVTEDPYSRQVTTDRYRPFVRTTEEPDDGDSNGDGKTTEDPYGRTTTGRYTRFGSRFSTEDPFKRVSGRITTNRPFGRSDGDGETTEDPFSRYRGTTDRYSRFGMKTTEDPFGRGSGRTTERYRPFGRGDGGGETTEDPFSRYRGTTNRYSRFGTRTTEDPFQRSFGRTTPRYGRLPGDGDETTDDPYSTRGTYSGRYTTEGPLWGRRTTPDYGYVELQSCSVGVVRASDDSRLFQAGSLQTDDRQI
uniref:Uncharacterized protein n=1 Tax=Romanomermis culicivorax TaxID=13658 RepID=A0A915IND9_ROMCU